jgi:uncharacterized membrane protein YkoI
MILTAGLLFAVLASSQEKKIKRSDLPPAVEKTVAAQSAGATVKGISKENEKGQTYYEAEMIVNGHTKDIQIDTSGAIVEVEEQVAMDALPAEVKAGLQARAGDGKLVKVETITKKDKLVAYEAQVTKGAKKLEVQVGPNGKPLDHEE